MLKVAIPLLALTDVVPERVPALGFVPIAMATLAELVVTSWLLASSTATVTGGAIALLTEVALGWVVKASWLAGPTIVNGLLVTTLNTPLEAPRV